MYANVGALGNPQPKIIGVRYDWEESQTIQFEVIIASFFAIENSYLSPMCHIEAVKIKSWASA